MFWLLFFAALTISVTTANAGTLPLYLLPNPTFQPKKIVYQIDSFPLTFEVSSQHNNASDACQGIEGAQFGIIAVYGKNNGINIVPSWGKDTTKYSVDFYFIQNGTDAANTSLTDLPFSTGATQRIIYNITIDYGTIKIMSKNTSNLTKIISMDPAYLPDFVDSKYLSLAFFQPQQADVPAMKPDVNKCNLFLDYNGKFVWQPPQSSAPTAPGETVSEIPNKLIWTNAAVAK